VTAWSDDDDAKEIRRLQRLGALAAIKSRLEEIRKKVIERNFADSILEMQLRRYGSLRSLLENLLQSRLQAESDGQTGAMALETLLDLDTSWTKPAASIDLLQQIVLDTDRTFALRSASLEALTDSRNVTSETVEVFKKIMAMDSSLDNDRLAIQLSRNHEITSDLLGDAFKQRLARNDTAGDTMIKNWRPAGEDSHFLFNSYNSSPTHRKIRHFANAACVIAYGRECR